MPQVRRKAKRVSFAPGTKTESEHRVCVRPPMVLRNGRVKARV